MRGDRKPLVKVLDGLNKNKEKKKPDKNGGISQTYSESLR